MAVVDSSIYANQQAPDILGGIQQGMKLSQLATQNKLQQQDLADKQGVRDAYKGNLTQDANGNMVLNKQGFLSSLANVNPEKAFEYQKTLAQNERDTQKAQLEQHSQTLGLVSQLAGGITDQATLDATRAKAKQWGLPAEELPEVWNDDAKAHVLGLQKSALSTKDQIDTQRQQLGVENDQKKTGIESRKADIEAGKLQLEREKAFGTGAPVGPVSPDTDPAVLVRRMVPEKHQQKAFDQLEAAQNTAANSKGILTAFDNAANNFHGMDLVPGIDNADQKQLHALLGPTFKDVEGTVRQAAMDNAYKTMTPQWGDNADTKKKKREALIGYLTSKQSAPDLAGYGINLKNFNSTKMHDPKEDVADDKAKSVAANQKPTPPAPPHPQDKEAVQWALANVNNPQTAAKANQILQLNGHSVGQR